MKLCLTAQGGSPESKLDPRFGRCGYFIFTDTENGGFEVIENEAAAAAHGAGIQAARTALDKKPDVLITGNIGPNSMTLFSQAGVKVYTGFEGTINEAVKAFKENKLKPADSATVESHSGLKNS